MFPSHFCLSALDCDISLQNKLAVANTALLRAYGGIDPRVRELVFLVKHWAKRRHLNSPSDGTLSSYGFILCLIHFLQVTLNFEQQNVDVWLMSSCLLSARLPEHMYLF